MTGSTFIFSNSRKPRLARHIIFWVLYYLQAVLATTEMKRVADFFDFNSYKYGLISAGLLLPVCFWSVYAALNLLFPFFQKKRYGVFVLGFLFLIVTNCAIVLVLYLLTKPYTCVSCGSRFEMVNTVFSLGINVAGFLAVIVLGIKFTKSWYLQQLNNLKLARQKTFNELKLLKTRMQPEFLFKILQLIGKKIETDNHKAAELLLKFSELLNYTLYECDEDFVAAERVIQITKEFVSLEKAKMKTKIIASFTHTESANKYIPSFVVLPLLQLCIGIIEDQPVKKRTVEIDITSGEVLFKCVFGVQISDTPVIKEKYIDVVKQFRERLTSLYENRYEISVSETRQKLFVSLSLLLSGTSKDQVGKSTFNIYEAAPV